MDLEDPSETADTDASLRCRTAYSWRHIEAKVARSQRPSSVLVTPDNAPHTAFYNVGGTPLDMIQ
jgi:hypothetical protein